MKIKSIIGSALSIAAILSAHSHAAVTYSFSSQDTAFDGLTTANPSLTDGSTAFIMTVSSVGGNLNSNATGLGVGDANIDGTDESIVISFNIDVEFNSIDLSGVGSDATDGASFTINASTTNLFTGNPSPSEFNGSTDVYTPSSPILLTSGDTILLTGSSATSTYDLDGINVTAVPEPATGLLGAFGGLLLIRRRR